MARVYLSNILSIAYTVDDAVGAGCTNREDDVLLVQFFLKVISEGSMKDKFKPAAQKPLVCDGRWGTQSQAYLDHFLRAAPGVDPILVIKRDGKVEPVRGGKLAGSASHTLYTILVMNALYGRTRGASARNDITNDALFPPGLKPSLKLP